MSDIPDEVTILVELLADALMDRLEDMIDEKLCQECPLKLVITNQE